MSDLAATRGGVGVAAGAVDGFDATEETTTGAGSGGAATSAFSLVFGTSAGVFGMSAGFVTVATGETTGAGS
jgi:hypothetical protein